MDENNIIEKSTPDKSTRTAEVLMAILSEVEFFYDEQNNTYATLKVDGHYKTVRVDKNFQDWLSNAYFKQTRKIANKNILQEVLNVIQAQAKCEGKLYQVFTRVAFLNNTIYVDLANGRGAIVKLTQEGWVTTQVPAIKFLHTESMRALPIPKTHGDINLLWKYTNVPKEARLLVIAWLLECLRAHTPFLILLITGQQGSAKSTTQNILRDLIDPNVANLRNAPRKAEDIYVAAVNNYFVSFNNVSNLTAQNQDDLCCLATGGGVATRELFTTMNEKVTF
jgi:hypothetical protein